MSYWDLLRSRYRVGVVTNGASETQRGKLRRMGLDSFFDPIFISEEVGFRKPDSQIFVRAIQEWKVPASEVLFVSDDPVADVEGARHAGMQAMLVTSPQKTVSILSKAFG